MNSYEEKKQRRIDYYNEKAEKLERIAEASERRRRVPAFLDYFGKWCCDKSRRTVCSVTKKDTELRVSKKSTPFVKIRILTRLLYV